MQEDHVEGKKSRVRKHDTGTQSGVRPTRYRLARSQERTLRSRQRWRHEAYGAVRKPCD